MSVSLSSSASFGRSMSRTSGSAQMERHPSIATPFVRMESVVENVEKKQRENLKSRLRLLSTLPSKPDKKKKQNGPGGTGVAPSLPVIVRAPKREASLPKLTARPKRYQSVLNLSLDASASDVSDGDHKSTLVRRHSVSCLTYTPPSSRDASATLSRDFGSNKDKWQMADALTDAKLHTDTGGSRFNSKEPTGLGSTALSAKTLTPAKSSAAVNGSGFQSSKVTHARYGDASKDDDDDVFSQGVTIRSKTEAHSNSKPAHKNIIDNNFATIQAVKYDAEIKVIDVSHSKIDDTERKSRQGDAHVLSHQNKFDQRDRSDDVSRHGDRNTKDIESNGFGKSHHGNEVDRSGQRGFVVGQVKVEQRRRSSSSGDDDGRERHTESVKVRGQYDADISHEVSKYTTHNNNDNNNDKNYHNAHRPHDVDKPSHDLLHLDDVTHLGKVNHHVETTHLEKVSHLDELTHLGKNNQLDELTHLHRVSDFDNSRPKDGHDGSHRHNGHDSSQANRHLPKTSDSDEGELISFESRDTSDKTVNLNGNSFLLSPPLVPHKPSQTPEVKHAASIAPQKHPDGFSKSSSVKVNSSHNLQETETLIVLGGGEEERTAKKNGASLLLATEGSLIEMKKSETRVATAAKDAFDPYPRTVAKETEGSDSSEDEGGARKDAAAGQHLSIRSSHISASSSSSSSASAAKVEASAAPPHAAPAAAAAAGGSMEVEIVKCPDFGLGFCVEGGKGHPGGDKPVTVKRIFSGQTSVSKHLRVGDEILTAANQDMTTMSHVMAWKFLRSLPDGPIKMTIIRKNN